jgi:hypothetical protein
LPRRDRSLTKVGRTGARFPRTAVVDEPGGLRTTEGGDSFSDREATDLDIDAAALPVRGEHDAVSVTGARFPRRAADPNPYASVLSAPATAPVATGPDAFSRDTPPVTEHRSTTDHAPADFDDDVTAAHGVPVVRPYVLTHGRTRSAVDLPLEALVTVGSAADHAAEGMDRTLMGLCQELRSVAEIAALADVPLGVARVLIGDLVTSGALVVHGTTDPQGPSLALLQRVLGGLRNL